MLTLESIQEAHQRIAPYIHHTPVLTSRSIDLAVGAQLFFKAENFQKIGAFKARGATNAVLRLMPAEAARGVVTHSSGNHGAAVARAARLRGLAAHVVMPRTVPRIKHQAVRDAGATIVWCEPTLQAREAVTAELLARHGGSLIHPYNDFDVMAGQGTAMLELAATVPDLDGVMCPVGGGGLLSGTAVAGKGRQPSLRVIGAEPQGADDAARSFATGTLAAPPIARTIADGLRGALGELTFATIRQHVDDIVTVSEDAIVAAMRLIWDRLKIIVEPSAAVPLAALLERKVPALAGRRIGIILSGGNVDLDALPWGARA